MNNDIVQTMGVNWGVLIAWGAIIFLMLANRKRMGKGILAPLLMVTSVIAGVFFLRGMRSAPPDLDWAYPIEKAPVAAREQSTEEMWNRLTEARIKLEGESTGEPQAETASPSPARPAWVDAGSKRVGGEAVEVAQSEPFTTVDECFGQLEHQFLSEVARRMKTVAPEGQKELIAKTPVEKLGIPLDYVMQKICLQEYTETVDTSVGDMKRVFVLMRFTPETDSHLLSLWQTRERAASLGLVARLATLVLASLVSVYGLLRVDTATRGYYTNRLIAGASAVIIAIAAALFVR